MLDVREVHTYYGESHVLQGVTFRADKGTVTAVLGRNGVGKTTLCRSLVGLTPPRSGRVLLNGTDITGLPPHRIHQLGVSLVPQGRRIFASLSVRENLEIAAARASRGNRTKARRRQVPIVGTLNGFSRYFRGWPSAGRTAATS